MRPYVEEACELIDAAMFSGDSFLDDGNRKELRDYLARWEQELTQWDLIAISEAEEEQSTKEES